MESSDIELARYRALHGIACSLTRLKWLRDAERLTLAMIRHDRALKAGFNPEQPRDELGRWTDANGSVATSRQTPVASQGPTSGVPTIPKEKPPTSRERVRAREHKALLLMSAESRVAKFLLEVAGRDSRRGAIGMPLVRQELADHLGLTFETVSRILWRLERSKIISLPERHSAVIKNTASLKRMSA